MINHNYSIIFVLYVIEGDLLKYDINKLMEKQLPTQVIINNFIEGHPANYEEYLTDFINSSKLVQEHGNSVFILRDHKRQSQGQSDIYNNLYQLDFKILVDKNYMEAKNLYTDSISEYFPGCWYFGAPKKIGTKKVYNIIKCFRKTTFNDIVKIESQTQSTNTEKVIKQSLKNLSTNKNVLFFIPYNYYLQNTKTNEDIAIFIVNCISEDLEGLLEYRKSKVNFDTYISFISDDYFIIAKERNKKLFLYDMIHTKKSVLFDYLMNVIEY